MGEQAHVEAEGEIAGSCFFADDEVGVDGEELARGGVEFDIDIGVKSEDEGLGDQVGFVSHDGLEPRSGLDGLEVQCCANGASISDGPDGGAGLGLHVAEGGERELSCPNDITSVDDDAPDTSSCGILGGVGCEERSIGAGIDEGVALSVGATELLIPGRLRCVVGSEFAGAVDDRFPVPNFFAHSAGGLARQTLDVESEGGSRDAIQDVLGGESFTRAEGNWLEGGETLTQISDLAEDGDDDGSVVIVGADSSNLSSVRKAKSISA